MRVIIEPDYALAAKWSANYVARSINEFGPNKAKPFVLGLPTGSSPLGVYEELIKLNKKGTVSFENVITFNMDECRTGEDTSCQDCAYNINKINDVEVVTCIARHCDISDHVESEAIDKAIGTQPEPIDGIEKTMDDLVFNILESIKL